MIRNVFILLILVLVILTNVNSVSLSSCATLNASTSYTLTQNISTTGTCLTFGGNNINLDCQGYTISGDRSGPDYGISITSRNYNNISNCIIEKFYSGIYFTGNSDYNKFENITLINNSYGGVEIYGDVWVEIRYNTFNNIRFLYNPTGLWARSLSYNNFTNLNFVNTTSISIYLTGTTNYDTDANIFSNFTITNSSYYSIYNNNAANTANQFINGTLSSYVYDIYGQNFFTNVSYNQTISQNFGPITLFNSGNHYLATNITTTQEAFTFSNNNTNLDCQGYKISGDNTGTDYGIHIDSKNYNNISNCIIEKFYSGIYFTGNADYNKIENVTLTNNSYSGIELNGLVWSPINYNTFNNINFSYNTNYGLKIHSSTYNNFTNLNFINTTSINIFLSGTTNYDTDNNVFSNFTITNSSSYSIYNGNSANNANQFINGTLSTYVYDNTYSANFFTNVNYNKTISINIGGPITLFNTGNHYLATNITTTTDGFNFNNNNVNLDCMGYKISGDRTGNDYGIYLNLKDYNNISNCIIEKFYSGIYLYSDSDYNKIENITLFNNSYAGIELYGFTWIDQNYNSLNLINSSNNTNYGILIRSTSYTNITNSILNNNQIGLFVNGIANNEVMYNNIKNNSFNFNSNKDIYNSNAVNSNNNFTENYLNSVYDIVQNNYYYLNNFSNSSNITSTVSKFNNSYIGNFWGNYTSCPAPNTSQITYLNKLYTYCLISNGPDFKPIINVTTPPVPYYVSPTYETNSIKYNIQSMTINVSKNNYPLNNMFITINNTNYSMTLSNEYYSYSYSIPNSTSKQTITFEVYYNVSGSSSSIGERTISVYPIKQSNANPVPAFGILSIIIFFIIMIGGFL